MVEIKIEMKTEEAEAIAQFFKRIGVDDFRKLAKDDNEAYTMQNAGVVISRALADAGFSPR